MAFKPVKEPDPAAGRKLPTRFFEELIAYLEGVGLVAYPADGAGGAIVTWYDLRSGDYDIYAQRVDAFGAIQ